MKQDNSGIFTGQLKNDNPIHTASQFLRGPCFCPSFSGKSYQVPQSHLPICFKAKKIECAWEWKYNCLYNRKVLLYIPEGLLKLYLIIQ